VLELAETATDQAWCPYQERLSHLSEQIGRSESRLAAIESELVQVVELEVEASWIGSCLRELHRLWDILSPVNRVRLLCAVIERVEVEERDGNVVLTLVDWGRGTVL